MHRIWGDDRGDLTQPPTAQAIRTHGKPASVVIGERQSSAPQLPTQDTVLFNEIAEYVSVLAVQPPGEDGEQQLERRGVHHGGNLYHGPGVHGSSRPSIQPRDITGSAFEFGVDIDQDLVRAVTGTPDDAALGHKLSGMDALHCGVRVTVDGLTAILRTYVDKNADDGYKRRFPWIDHIADVSDKALIAELDARLVDTINGERERCWLCVPEIIDWNRTGGFRYAFTVRAPMFHDLRFDDFLETLDGADVDIDALRRRRAHCVDNEGRPLDDWSIYRCIYGELELRGQTYVLSTGRWYRVETDFVTAVNAHFDQLSRYLTPLPEYDDASEGHYCARVARESPATYALMDQKMIQIGGAHGQVEFCDLFTSTKDLLHLKRYGASSVLSHLFSQGLVSGEAFRSDAVFRRQAADLLPEPFRSFSGEQPLNPGEYHFCSE